jgi:hypothetical protein
MTSISLNHQQNAVPVLDIIRDLWPTRPSRRRHYVDVRELPDHLKRDVGILDGSRPTGGVRW